MGVARFILPTAVGALSLAVAAPALAGGCCNLPTTHTVQIPGVVVSAPGTTLGGSSGCSSCGGVGSGSGGGSGSGSQSGSGSDSGSSSSSTSSSSSDVSASSYGSASAYGSASSSASNSATVANLLASGGGSSFYVDQGPSSTIGTLNVETPAQPAPVCLQYASSLVVAAVQATCLDDKDVPHPASQVMPGREVADGYMGEVFRCIAGSRMQYVVGAFAGQPDFSHGQTLVCRKGDALWRGAGGQLQCRPQTPARDCNERSLLRRYGAGIKVMRFAGGGQCVRWGGGAGVAEAGPPGAVTGMLIDGGVGGVAH